MPTLIVWGKQDAWIPVDCAYRLAETIPKSELRIIDGAGHLVQEDKPDELIIAIEKWLNRSHE